MNLEYLSTLVSIVEHKSLSAAARARHISQPAVTKQLQKMEAEFGMALLVRGPKRDAELTPAGELVLSFARDVLAQLERLEHNLAVLQKVGQGTLVLAASTIPGEYVLPSLLATFRDLYPQVKIRMSISDTSDVAQKLLNDEADLGVVGSALQQPGLRLERLVGDHVVLVVPPKHAWAHRKTVTIDELQGQPLILREEGSGTRQSVEQGLSEAGRSLPYDDVILTLGSTQAVLQAVGQGLGIGFASARAAARQQADGHLACLVLQDVDLSRDLYLAYAPQRVGDPLVAHFLRFAHKSFSD